MVNQTWTIKITLLGDARVGKTSIRRSYLGQSFIQNYMNTIGADFSFKQLFLDKDKINCSIWDLAGQEIYEKIHPQYYFGSSTVILVYDITNNDSLNDIEHWINNFHIHSGIQNGPILIVGNKIDLINSESEMAKLKEDQDTLIESLQQNPKYNYQYTGIFTSAKTGSNIEIAFELIIRSFINFVKTGSISRNRIEFRDVLPSAYIIAFHERFGPTIIAKSPSLSSSPVTENEFINTIKVSSVINFNELIETSQAIGIFPWDEPTGSFHYIAFTIKNSKARGNYALYLLGFVIRKKEESLIGEKSPIVNGYLHNKMNLFTILISKINASFVIDESIENKEIVISKIESILLALLEEVFQLIDN